MRKKPWILLTGATGFVGRRLLTELLADGESVAVLLRPTRKHRNVAHRWLEFLQTISVQYLSRCALIPGDITHETCGAAASDMYWLQRNCNRLIHCAADVSFGSAQKSDQVNVGGTRHVLQLREWADISDFHYVSTAYVCGDRRGELVTEDPASTATARNAYERSKREAEKLVLDLCDPTRRWIYRPSIVVGDYRTGETACFQSFYALIRFVHLLLQRGGKYLKSFGNIQLSLSGDEPVNLVPVSMVARAISMAVAGCAPSGIFHITGSTPPRTRDVAAAICSYFNIAEVYFSGVDSPAADDFLSKQFREYLGPYADYWGNDPFFSATGLKQWFPEGCWEEVDAACLRRLIDYAIRTDFGKQIG